MKRVYFDFEVSTRYEYYVTENGEIFRIDTRNGIMSEYFYHIAHGYKRIRITDIKSGIRRYIRVHRLVALYYVENPNPDLYNQVNHIDGNKMNNHYSNLEWCNCSINTQHAYDNNLVKDRGGWKSTPYEKRINKRYGNTEGDNI